MFTRSNDVVDHQLLLHRSYSKSQCRYVNSLVLHILRTFMRKSLGYMKSFKGRILKKRDGSSKVKEKKEKRKKSEREEEKRYRKSERQRMAERTRMYKHSSFICVKCVPLRCQQTLFFFSQTPPDGNTMTERMSLECKKKKNQSFTISQESSMHARSVHKIAIYFS